MPCHSLTVTFYGSVILEEKIVNFWSLSQIQSNIIHNMYVYEIMLYTLNVYNVVYQYLNKAGKKIQS